MNRAIIMNINRASKIYRYTSWLSRYPSKPCRYSTTRNTDRTITSILAAKRTNMCFSHPVTLSARVVGRPRILEWKFTWTTTKRPKKSSWMNRPATVMWAPLFSDAASPPVAWIPPPGEMDQPLSIEKSYYGSRFARTCALDEEGKNIAANENLDQPALTELEYIHLRQS